VRDFEADDQEELAWRSHEISNERARIHKHKHDELYEADAHITIVVEQLSKMLDGFNYWLLSSDHVIMYPRN
jgi:hypothetical protein